MNILNMLSAAREKAFARDLVQRLTRELPPSLMEKRRTVLSVNKVTRLLERTYQAAGTYQMEHRLGFFKRAMLANAFKWELRGQAYPDDFIDLATEGLVVELSKATKPQNAKKA